MFYIECTKLYMFMLKRKDIYTYIYMQYIFIHRYIDIKMYTTISMYSKIYITQ